MNTVELAVINLKETRRRSHKLWRSLPDEWLSWRPDIRAMSFGEMIRHVWTGQVYYHESIKAGGSVPNFTEPYEHRPVTNIDEEFTLSVPYFEEFIAYVESLKGDELSTRTIDRSDVGYVRSIGDMLARIAYHEAVHTGQFLQYLRMAGLERPQIWD